MATKDQYCLSLKEENQHLVSSNQNGQYNNLNLNANQTNPILETVQSKSISSYSNRNNNYATTKVSEPIETGKTVNHNKLSSSSWKNNGGGIWSNGSNMLGSFGSNQTSKNDKTSTTKATSTLSLHIAAYVNSIEAPVGLNSAENDEIGSKQKRCNKTSKNFKTFSAPTVLGCFEIPRQQSEGPPTSEPEIMQFKASQKLLNPNMSANTSIINENKVKIHLKIFADKCDNVFTLLESALLELKKQTSFEQLISIAFDKVGLSKEKFEIKSFLVLNKKSSEYISVAENYILQPFDKFQLYLAQKKQIQETDVSICYSETKKETMTIDTSRVESIKDLSSLLHEKLDVKEGKIEIEKFDEDFEENVGVEDGEKFDPTKRYDSQITKIFRFSAVVQPLLVAASNDTKVQQNELIFKPENVKVEAKLNDSAVMISSKQEPNIEPALKVPVDVIPEMSAIVADSKTGKAEIIKAAQTVPCPLSEPELKSIESDRATKPASLLVTFEAKNEKLKMEFDVLLDKLTASNFKDVSTEIIKRCNWNDVDALLKFIDLILEKAITEQDCCGMYVDLCHSIHKAEKSAEKENFKRHFHCAILQTCQRSFEDVALSQDQDIPENQKQRNLGILKFTCHLYRVHFLKYKIIDDCIATLLQNARSNGSELMLEYGITFMKEVGPFMVQRNDDKNNLDVYVAYLGSFKEVVSPRVKAIIVDLMELRDRKWAEKADDIQAPVSPPLATGPSSMQSHNSTVTPEDRFNKAAFTSSFKTILQSHFNGVGFNEAIKSLIQLNNDLNNSVLFFEQMFAYACENLKLDEREERHAVAKLVARSRRYDQRLWDAFVPAFAKYCKYLVENDIEGDVPHLKTTFPQFVAHLITDPQSIPFTQLFDGFKEFHESGNYMFARTLVELGRILHSRHEADVAGLLCQLFNEFADADEYYNSYEMHQIYAKQPIDYLGHYKNLEELISFF